MHVYLINEFLLFINEKIINSPNVMNLLDIHNYNLIFISSTLNNILKKVTSIAMGAHITYSIDGAKPGVIPGHWIFKYFINFLFLLSCISINHCNC